jgi:SAM-dependent methyltransferase
MKQETVDKLLVVVKKNYETIASDFDLTRKKEIWPKMRELAATVPAGARVLDLGCGNGRLLEALENKEIEYLGLDNSEALIEIAWKNYPGKQFRVKDILNLALIPENNFDYIFCLAVLQHIPGCALRLEALKQMAGKLKPGGELIISAWNLWKNKKYRPLLLKNYWLKIRGRNPLGFNDLLFPWKNSRGEKTSERYYHAFTKKELKKLAHLTGLKPQKLERDVYNYWYILKK